MKILTFIIIAVIIFATGRFLFKKFINNALFKAVSASVSLKDFVPGKVEDVQFLLDLGADINIVDNKGCSLLMYADSKDLDMIQFLLDAGIDVNKVDKSGNTALMKHIWNPEVIKLLLKAGANVNSQNNEGKTALQIAQGAKNEEILKLLKAAGAK